MVFEKGKFHFIEILHTFEISTSTETPCNIFKIVKFGIYFMYSISIFRFSLLD